MDPEHHIYCGDVSPAASAGAGAVRLNLRDDRPGWNVRLKVEELHKRLYRNTPPQFLDLLEIATYVYCGDTSVKRGARDVQTLGANWRRRFHFHIPVRKPGLWKGAEVQQVLRETLEFLSDDFYEFTFEQATDPRLLQGYFPLVADNGATARPEQVIMFSGGLDSLAGAIEEIVVKKRPVVLLNHLSTPKFSRRFGELQRLLTEKSAEVKPLHLRVEINKDESLGKEYTQRARSFLYASTGAAVAKMLGLSSVRFYENGVVSLNLPVCAQVVGGRATRTTHPRVLAGFQHLFSLLAGESFTVENPFLWNTKGEVVRKIVEAGCGELIGPSRSCAHTWETSNEHSHCGVCSQCIDRRFGIIAARAEEFDQAGQYKLDVFTESRPKDEDKIMGAAYLQKAIACKGLKDVGRFMTDNAEVVRVLRFVEGKPASAALRTLDLHRRHAKEVTDALKVMLQRNLDGVIELTLPPDCLLRTAYESGTLTTMPAVDGSDATPTAGAGKDSLNGILMLGGLEYRAGFMDVWFRDKHYDLRSWKRARFCIECMVKKNAIDAETALELEGEIDTYVREKADMAKAADLRIDHYFNDREGKLKTLRKDLIHSAGGGRYFLKVS